MPEPLWLAELRRLHAAHHSDAVIADELSTSFYPRVWNRQQVWRLRRKLRLKTWRHDAGRIAADMLESRRWRWRQHQVDAGWLHLLPLAPGEDEDEPDEDGKPPLRAEMCPREVAILTALCDRGPLTRLQLAVHLGLCRPGGFLWMWRRHLDRLVRAGLVLAEVRRRLGRGCRFRYRLAPAAGQRSLSKEERRTS